MNFDTVLNQKVSEIERPPLIPVGTYRAAVARPYNQADINSANWSGNSIEFQLQLLEPQPDVDADDLRAFGSLKSSQVRHSFMFPKDDETGNARAAFNLKRFLVDHLKIEDAGDVSMKELLGQAQGRQCLVTVGLRPDKEDKQVWYNSVKATAPL